MEEIDELIPHPDKDGALSLTHRALIVLDSVIWTMKKELIFLNVSFNNIEHLPPELGDLLLLRELDVSCNKLEALPPELSKCQRLRKLKGNGNYLKTIPEGLGDCCLLEELVLSENRLQDIPESLAGLKALRVLRLQNNELKTLPYAMSAVLSMEELDCAGNSEFDLVPEAWRSDPTIILWICRLHQEHSGEVRELENLNGALEQRAQSSEEAKLRLKEEMRALEEQRRALLKERPGVYLAAKHQAVKPGIEIGLLETKIRRSRWPASEPYLEWLVDGNDPDPESTEHANTENLTNSFRRCGAIFTAYSAMNRTVNVFGVLYSTELICVEASLSAPSEQRERNTTTTMEMRLALDEVSVDKRNVQGLGNAALDATFIGHSVSGVAERQLRAIIEYLEVISNIGDANHGY